MRAQWFSVEVLDKEQASHYTCEQDRDLLDAKDTTSRNISRKITLLTAACWRTLKMRSQKLHVAAWSENQIAPSHREAIHLQQADARLFTSSGSDTKLQNPGLAPCLGQGGREPG